jgi:hypothetical protein
LPSDRAKKKKKKKKEQEKWRKVLVSDAHPYQVVVFCLVVGSQK